MEIYLVRHGQSMGNTGDPAAPPDPALTPTGAEQVKLTASWFAPKRIAAVYASPMTRALESALPLAAAVKQHVRVRADLAETPRFAWNDPPAARGPAPKTGLTGQEIEARFSGGQAKPDGDIPNLWWEPLHAERRAQAYARASRALTALRSRHEDDAILVVTHGAFGSVLIAWALGMTPADYNRVCQYNCGVSLLRISETHAQAVFLNWAEHIPEDLRTDLTF